MCVLSNYMALIDNRVSNSVDIQVRKEVESIKITADTLKAKMFIGSTSKHMKLVLDILELY